MVKTFYQDNHITLYNGDCRRMTELPDESVQMCVTSPPYWGLRKYSGVPDLVWGDSDCEHRWKLLRTERGNASGGHKSPKLQARHGIENFQESVEYTDRASYSNTCSLCGAWKGSYGLEPTPEMYIEHTIEILREMKRVLRGDGVVFWNIGDSYMSGGGPTRHYGWADPKNPARGIQDYPEPTAYPHPNIKPKDLCLIPFRVAIVAQEDGWWVRSVIIWSKPNPMPESVTDRPTESHEYILLLTKSARYYWDADAVREPNDPNHWRQLHPEKQKAAQSKKYMDVGLISGSGGENNPAGRNIRSVWTFPTQPYPEAHFAVFPEKLPEICIKAATPEVGCCSKCGAPWERITETKQYPRHNTEPHDFATDGDGANRGKHAKPSETKTIGWQPTCKCNAHKSPSLVLDCFAGAGTSLWVAKKLGRKAIGYELSEEYCQLALERNRQQVMV